MSESSADKTKRKILNNLSEYQWKQQISLYPNPPLDDLEKAKLLAIRIVPDNLNQFKDMLRRTFKEVGFFVSIRSLVSTRSYELRQAYPSKQFKQIYMTIFASEEVDEKKLMHVINSTYGQSVKDQIREVNPSKLMKSIKTIAREPLHSIHALLVDYPKIKRFSKLNAKKFKKKPIIVNTRNAPF